MKNLKSTIQAAITNQGHDPAVLAQLAADAVRSRPIGAIITRLKNTCPNPDDVKRLGHSGAMMEMAILEALK